MATTARKFDDVVSEAKELEATYSGVSAMWDEMEAMFFIKPTQEPKVGENAKITYSPDPHNKLLGAVRLMVATDPQPVVTKTDTMTQNSVDQIEQFCSTMWSANSGINGVPPHYDLITSGLLYGCATIGVVSMKRMQESMKGTASEKLAAQVLKRTPYLFETYAPRTSFPRFSRLGMTAHLRKVTTTAGQVIDDWGAAAEQALGAGKRTRTVTLCEWWDLEWHTVWVEGGKEPILHELHEMSFIPIASTITEGSQALFSKPEQQLMPFLFAVAKSGLWNRQNLALSFLYTMIFAIGGNPMFKYRRNQPGKNLEVDFSQPGGIVKLDPGEDFDPLLKQVIDPSLLQGMQIANEAVTESTIYPQALGQSLSGNQPYSTLALLSSSGRLPLIGPQKRLGWLIARAMWMACQWTKEPGEGGKIKAVAGATKKLDTSRIPDDLDLQVNLEINMPQDKLQLANVANLLSESGLLSKQWIRQNILGVSQDRQMVKQIWKERYLDMKAQQFAEQRLTPQAPMMQPGAGQLPPGMPPPGAEQPAPGVMPGGAGLPPELLAGGMQGPEQPGGQMLPPEGMPM